MYIRLFAPTILTATVILGIKTMQKVTKDIKTQCNYGIKYNSNYITAK